MQSIENLLSFSKNNFHTNSKFDETVVGQNFLQNVEIFLAPKRQQFTRKNKKVLFAALLYITDVEIILSYLRPSISFYFLNPLTKFIL